MKRFTFELPQELFDAFLKYAQDNERNVAQQLRTLMQKAVDESNED